MHPHPIKWRVTERDSQEEESGDEAESGESPRGRRQTDCLFKTWEWPASSAACTRSARFISAFIASIDPKRRSIAAASAAEGSPPFPANRSTDAMSNCRIPSVR